MQRDACNVVRDVRSFRVLLCLADLTIFLEFVVAHQGGEQDAVGTIAPAVKADETPPEVPEGLGKRGVDFRPDVFPEQDFDIEVGVFALLGDELTKRLVVVVDERIFECSGVPVEDGFLVNGASGIVTRVIPVEEAQLGVGPPACAAHPVAEDVIVARDPPAGFVAVGDDAADFDGKLRCGALIGVEEEDPISVGDVEGDVALLRVVLEWMAVDFGAGLLGQGDRSVGAVGVEDNDAVGPAYAVDAGGDVAFFVKCQDDRL